METNPLTCDAGTVAAGTNATIQCHYHVVTVLSAITVLFYPEHFTKASEKSVAVCLDSLNWGLHCEVAQGYILEPQLTTLTNETVAIRIANVSGQFAGYYACHTIPPEPTTSVHLCKLTVTDMVTAISLTTNSTTDADDGNPKDKVTILNSATNSTTNPDVLYLCPATKPLAIITALSLILLCAVLLWKPLKDRLSRDNICQRVFGYRGVKQSDDEIKNTSKRSTA